MGSLARAGRGCLRLLKCVVFIRDNLFESGKFFESLTILRTPKYEFFLEEWERGASVSFHRDLEGDETELLLEVFYAPDDKCITLRAGHQTFKLDVRKVDPRELSAMCDVFRKMIFDSIIRLTGV